MPRQRRYVGPRVKVDISTLRNMSPDERLRLLTKMAAECGGRSEDEWGDKFRAGLAKAKTRAPGRVTTSSIKSSEL